jgi:hypothetical protein
MIIILFSFGFPPIKNIFFHWGTSNNKREFSPASIICPVNLLIWLKISPAMPGRGENLSRKRMEHCWIP